MAERGLPVPKIPPTPKTTRAKTTDQAKQMTKQKGETLLRKTLQSRLLH